MTRRVSTSHPRGAAPGLLCCRRGSVALLFALLLMPTLLAIGVAVDFGRVYVATKTLQGIVDSAALAGAVVFSDATHEAQAISVASSYFSTGIASMPSNVQVSGPTISTTTASNCAEDSAERITVAATASVTTTLMGMVVPSMDVAVSATAANPQVEIFLDVVNFDFNAVAGDLNTLYWFKVPDDSSAPATSDLNYIISNITTSSPTTITACISSTQEIGFSMSVSPAGKYHYYNVNTYGGKYGNTYYYHSTLFPPTKNAYPSWPYDGSLQIVDVNTDGSYPSPTTSTFSPAGTYGYGYFPANAEPLADVASSGSVSCSRLDGGKIHLYWNDMGPSDDPETNPSAYDDYNYTDGEITFSCTSGTVKSVYLER